MVTPSPHCAEYEAGCENESLHICSLLSSREVQGNAAIVFVFYCRRFALLLWLLFFVQLLALMHTRGYGTRRVCQSICQFPMMAASNGHNSETSCIATKRGKGMGNVAFSDVILLKSLRTKREAREVTEMVGFSQRMCGDNTVDPHIWTTVLAGRK